MYILGITGNIGSGKSTVSQRLAKLGAHVSHSDDVAKNLLQNDSSILHKLSQRFGTDILDHTGKLQRATLAARAFKTVADQTFLNHLIHPAVRKATLARIELAREAKIGLFIIDAPLLFEAGVDEICDGVLVVSAKSESRQKRVNQRSQISKADFERRDKLQMKIEEKIARADYVIHNDADISELFEKVDLLYGQLIP